MTSSWARARGMGIDDSSVTASDYPPRPSPITPGYKLDRYEMLCPIAEGGMASVWVARLRGKRGFEKLVAIKTILPKFAQDARFQRMFLDEAGLAARIEHVNVAQVLDLGEEHDVLYLSMELVDGDALSKLLRQVQKKGLEIPPGSCSASSPTRAAVCTPRTRSAAGTARCSTSCTATSRRRTSS